MGPKNRSTDKPAGGVRGITPHLWAVLLVLFLTSPTRGVASITVTASGPGGQQSQSLPDEGGPFELNLPLQKNAVNTLTVTATDAARNTVSQELKVTQLSLDAVVVSQVKAERLTKEEIRQLVSDGVIQLDNPANYNVSKFDLVLTIGSQPIPISVTVPIPVGAEQTGWEVYKMPKGDGSGSGKPPPPPPQIIVFDQPVPQAAKELGIPSIPGVILIEGNIKSLKEFYTVRLLLMNTSGIFTLKDVMARIAFPTGGLSAIAPADGVLSFGDILPGDGGQPGQAERQFIIRGDEIGVRPVDVSFGGSIAGPGIAADKAIPFNGSATTEVEVKGPPTFRVLAIHPDAVVKDVPYEFKVDITNTAEIPALYASLALDVGADARLVRCSGSGDAAVCEEITGSDVRNFGDIDPGQTVSATFTIRPTQTGPITSCVGVSDQNISLQVVAGTIGCLAGQFPPERGVPDGVPTVAVVPSPNTQGVGIDTPVTAFFSQEMSPATITTGAGGSFNVFDRANTLVPGVLRLETLNGKTVAIWQVQDNVTNRWASNAEYTVYLTRAIANKAGVLLYNAWTSRFTTTGTALYDQTPPTLTLTVEPPVLPSYVLPGQLVTVDAYAADLGSGVVRVELRSKDLSVPDAPYQLVDRKVVFSGDKPPFLFTIDSGNLAPDRSYRLLATAYDYMMNAQNATIDLFVAGSASAPTIALPAPPGEGILQGISVSVTPTAVSGGVREVRYYLDGAASPFKTVNLPPYQAGLGTLSLPLGPHVIRAEARDGLGQTGQATYDFALVSNPNKPLISLTGATSGATYIVGSSFVVSGAATDPVGVASLLYSLDGTPIASGTQPFTIATAGLSAGAHQLVAQAVNNLGMGNTTTLDFVVAPLPNGPAPAAPVVTVVSVPTNGQVTVGGTSVPGARIDVTNDSQKFGITVNATGSGTFTAALAGSSGDALRLVAYDFTASQQPSPAAVVTVPAPPTLESIAAAPATMSFTAANQYQDVVVTGTYQGGSTANLTAQTVFSSSNPTVAAVNNAGRVVALKSGSAAIAATVAGKQAQAEVSVAIDVLSGISVDPPAISFTSVGQTRTLAVTGLWSISGGHTLAGAAFATADPHVATVTASGQIAATGSGSTLVTVYYPGVAPVQVAVIVNAALNQPPTVAILSPAASATVERGQAVTVSVRAQDGDGGVTKLTLAGSGQSTFSEMRQIAPPAADSTQLFTFVVSGSAAVGGTITLTATAEDVGSATSAAATVILTVVDLTAPTVTILQPPAGAAFNYGDTVNLSIGAADVVGVASIRFATSGGLTLGDTRLFAPTPLTAHADFSFTIPFGVVDPDLKIAAYATDAAGNERAAFPVDILITSADVTPPQTVVTAVAAPGTSAATTVTYQVISGLSDLDHVKLYFRKNQVGTYNRYTDAGAGNAEGKFHPQSGDVGTIVFDSTRMGGDGAYEFYTVGVDKAGNREQPPYDLNATGASRPQDGLILHYPFAGNAADASGNGNDGTLQGALFTADRLGVADRALLLDGVSAFVNAGTNPAFDFDAGTADFTIDAWIKPTAMPSYAAGIVGKATCGADPYTAPFSGWAFYYYADGRLAIGGAGVWEVASAAGTIETAKWAHVAVTKSGNTYRLFKNGLEVGSRTYGNLQTSTTALRVGSVYPDFFRLNGIIDDVAVYNRALTQGEINQFYRSSLLAVTPDQTASFTAGTVWTVIASPTVIGEGETTYEDRNLRISGASVTVNGAHAFQNVDLVNGAVLTHSAATTTSEYRLEVSAWSVSVDGTSAITTDGKGYPGGSGYSEAGRTVGNVPGSAGGAGGSYGGLGGAYSGSANPVYGYLTDPEDLGSGGGSWGWTAGGAGGGLIKLDVVNLSVDGAVRSNGGESGGSAAGDGSGGGINIRTATVSGSGSIQANGGGSGDGVGGGGGRIALSSVDRSTLHDGNVKALGGSGYYGNAGANGTVVFITSNKAELVLTGQGPSSPWIDLTLPEGFVFDSVTFRDNARVIAYDAFTVTGRVLLTGNSTLTHNTGNEDGLVINASVVQVDAGSAIDATGRGFAGSTGYSEPGWTLGGVSGAGAGAGGSYGGAGSGHEGRASGPVYGDPRNPVYLGSGGGSWGWTAGGNGGGRVTINASQSIVVNGAIRADGGESGGSAAGDGSGGSVLLHTSKLAGGGTITANGGGHGDGVGGGGGRVAVYCDYVQVDNDLDGLYNVTAFGRTGYYDTRKTTPGTVFVRYSNQGDGDLYIDGGIVDAAGHPYASNPDSIVLPALGFGTAAAVTADTLTTDGLVPMFPGALPGIRLNPDVDQQETFVIVSNTDATITVQSPNEHGVSFSDIAGVGRTYAGFYRFDNVFFRRGGNLMLGDLFQISDTLSIDEYGLLTHEDATATRRPRLELKAGTIEIDATGRIDVTGRGYIGSRGYSESGRTLGNVPGATAGAGGSYGGLATGHEGRASNAIYGSLTNPVDAGSGGGSWGWTVGGDGGGAVLIQASTIRVDGAIVADGGESGGSASGDGSGGTVNLRVGRLEGTGVIHANGGGQGSGSGGGGGRVAVVYTEALTLPVSNILALGGTGYYGSPGGNGTVYLFGPGQGHGDLIIDGKGFSTPGDTTRIPGGYTFDSITLRNAARVVADQGVTVTGTLLLTGDSVLTHGAGIESGLPITAAVVQVDAGSAIDATGRGYAGSLDYNGQGRTLGNVYGSYPGAGGSYGGLGGGYQSSSSALAFGDLSNPVYLGSGGGSWGWAAGGNGGGRITISASQEVIVDGVVAADGAASGGSAAGSGSGGSVLIRAPLVSGNGFIRANGGSVGVGGGGGRVAIFCGGIGPGGTLNNLYNVTAWSGHGYYDERASSSGTVLLKYRDQEQGDLYIDNHVVDAGGTPNGTAAASTPLTPIGFGTAAAATADSLSTDGLVAALAGGLAGLRINPDVTQAESFAISTNSGNTIVVQTPNENGVNFGALAAAGKTYVGVYRFDNVIFRRGGNLVLGDRLEVADTLSIAEYGVLTHYAATASFVSRLDVTVGALVVDATGRIDVSGRGYIGGQGYYERGRTLGNAAGAAEGTGGSFGGLAVGYEGRVSNPTYGSATDPADLGSGGGSWGWTVGGSGGGLAVISAGTVTLDGDVAADGGASGGSAAGSGSGGTVNIRAVSVGGSGSVHANGVNTGAGGGGGRVAIVCSGTLTLPAANVTASGAAGGYGTGGDGTVYLERHP
ncbi:MAG: Ig-like domain-containing protein [Deltaproteobacteria bacterium]|nr:Ig-like domain-containing protein [Deltaproteobacteria bacterium]